MEMAFCASREAPTSNSRGSCSSWAGATGEPRRFEIVARKTQALKEETFSLRSIPLQQALEHQKECLRNDPKTLHYLLGLTTYSE